MIPGIVQTQPWVESDAEEIPVPGVRLIVSTGMDYLKVADHTTALRAANKRVTLTLNTDLEDAAQWAERVTELCATVPGSLVEIWNEPNPEDWPRYWEFLRVASPIIRAAGKRVCLGGQPPARAEVFWRAAHKRHMFRYVDAVGLHPYILDPNRQIEYVRARRQQLWGYGVDSPLILSEFGWGTGTGTMAVSERVQGECLTRAFTNFSREADALGIERAHWFSWRDWPGGYNWDHHAGLIGPDNTLRLAGRALADLYPQSEEST